MALLLSAIKIALAALLGFCLLLYFRQDAMIFLGAGLPAGMLEELRRAYPGSEITLTAPDGVRLHGWYRRAESPSPAPLLIYFGGNAEDVSGMLLEEARFPGISLLLVNYRGYGLSAGKPTQRSLTRDALFLYDHFATRPEVDSERIMAMGRSLGTCVAVELAAQRQVARLVLISPFESLRALAKELYPWFPVGPFLRHPFDIIERAPAIKAPLLAVIAGRDRIVPPAHSRRLVAAWGGKTEILELPGADHNEVGPQPEFWNTIAPFLAQGRKNP
ncbi:MAG: dienelactone hydrolase family protein [Deltaproteobacteria bacterium]|nr:dienelactone hydrolase family protein [Deltaproteobacteria bacterium]